jgi:hypothetical protein
MFIRTIGGKFSTSGPEGKGKKTLNAQLSSEEEKRAAC